jgi:hypothetical protein
MDIERELHCLFAEEGYLTSRIAEVRRKQFLSWAREPSLSAS